MARIFVSILKPHMEEPNRVKAATSRREVLCHVLAVESQRFVFPLRQSGMAATQDTTEMLLLLLLMMMMMALMMIMMVMMMMLMMTMMMMMMCVCACVRAGASLA